ncbi:MAG: D-alanyl-D-alanine carboxypeptidase/D-alanyl-D-alanine-endopeptidase [Phycisphaerae bacterium]|nr:D-alanyl-D-alanine carboxypeptidase/D-alanyl-D-alanine-endopeptidase [Phycisphaerae bacterium]
MLTSLNSKGAAQKEIEQILARKDQAKVKFSILITEAETGKAVFRRSENLSLTPASNMKLVTSFAALKYLGKEFEFVTTAAIVGKSLFIIGSGDPLLGLADVNNSDFISKIISAIKEKNINEIEDIVIDSSVFEDNRCHPNWPPDQLNRPYACEVSGLNYNGNCLKISAINRDGQIILTTEPATDYLTLINKVQPLSKGDSAIGAYRTEKENVIIVNGKCRRPASFDVAIERPAAFFGFLLAENLNNSGIKTSGRLTVKTVGSERLQILVEQRTAIIDVLARCNKDSFQLAAESLFKTLGARLIAGGRGGSWQNGQKAVTDYLISLGAEPTNFNIDDGSGLSSKNKLTADIIVRVLSDAYSSNLWPMFRDTLASGGIDGTLQKYFYQNKYRGKVFAKTGYINGVRALSGSFIAGDKEYIFSMLANDANFNTKVAMYDIIKAIIDEEN